MTNWNTCPAVERDPRKISGVWAFTGTRVPVYALFENLESGATVKQFLEWYPEGQGVAGGGYSQPWKRNTSGRQPDHEDPVQP